MARCIITGCALAFQGEQRYAWGDLHMQGDQYIFNAVVGRDGQTHWQEFPDEDGAAKTKAIILGYGCDYFERRGVFVIPAAQARLNTKARLYIGEAP